MSRTGEQLQEERARRFDFRVELQRAADGGTAMRVAVAHATTLALEGASAGTIHTELVEARVAADTAEAIVEHVAEQWRVASKSAISQFTTGIGIFVVGLVLTAWSASTAEDLTRDSGGSVRTVVWLGALLGGPAMSLRAVWWSGGAAAFYLSLLRLRRGLGRSVFGELVRRQVVNYSMFAPAVVVGGGAFLLFHVSDWVAFAIGLVTCFATLGAMLLFDRRRDRP